MGPHTQGRPVPPHTVNPVRLNHSQCLYHGSDGPASAISHDPTHSSFKALASSHLPFSSSQTLSCLTPCPLPPKLRLLTSPSWPFTSPSGSWLPENSPLMPGRYTPNSQLSLPGGQRAQPVQRLRHLASHQTPAGFHEISRSIKPHVHSRIGVLCLTLNTLF